MIDYTSRVLLVKLSKFEASLVKKLRMYDMGEFIVYKTAGEPRRVKIGGIEFLKEEEGPTIAENLSKTLPDRV